jgi:hypothetical protein
MNEHLIREIANASSEYAESTVSYYDGTKDGLDYPAKMMKVRDLKFAESIVQDIHQYVDSMDTAQVISNGILRRYGVEE